MKEFCKSVKNWQGYRHEFGVLFFGTQCIYTHCYLRSSASAICSDWHSTGSTRPDCNWTTKFRSQRTSHMEPSATSTTVTGSVGAESAFKRALKTHLFSTARRHWDVFTILAPDINIDTSFLRLLISCRPTCGPWIMMFERNVVQVVRHVTLNTNSAKLGSATDVGCGSWCRLRAYNVAQQNNELRWLHRSKR